MAATGSFPISSYASAYVYCLKQKKGLPQTSATVGLPLPSNGNAIATADTPACSGKRVPIGGGFEAPPYINGQGIALPVESRRAGDSWRARTANYAGPQGAPFTAFAVCG